MSLFDRFFRNDDEEDPHGLGEGLARDILEFASTAYYPVFLRWVENEAMRPVKLGTGQDMLVSAARQNAFLEIRAFLNAEVRKASALATEDHGT